MWPHIIRGGMKTTAIYGALETVVGDNDIGIDSKSIVFVRH